VQKQEFEIDVGKLVDHEEFLRDFGLSRHVFREMAHQCLLPGVTKSSW
jgi:ribosomal protein S14